MGLLPDGVTTQKSDVKKEEKHEYVINQNWASIEWTLLKAAKTLQFWAFVVLIIAVAISYTAILNHFVALVTDIGYTEMFAATLLSIFAISAVVSRLAGIVSDVYGRELICTLCALVAIISLLFLYMADDTSSPWILYVFVLLFGISSGILAPAQSAAGADVFQGKNFGLIFGTVNMAFGLGAAIGTWLFGYIHDITGNYDWAISTVIAAFIVQTIAIWIIAPRKIRRIVRKTS
jgi:MFS family permease